MTNKHSSASSSPKKDGPREREIDKLRLAAFETNSNEDKAAYYLAVSQWFQDRHSSSPHPHPPAEVGELVERLNGCAEAMDAAAKMGSVEQRHYRSDAVREAAALLASQAEKLAAVEADNETLRSIISDCAKATGAHVSPACTLEFTALLPKEITIGKESDRARIAVLEKALEEMWAEFDRLRDAVNRPKCGQPFMVGGRTIAPWGIVNHAIAALDLSMHRADIIDDLKGKLGWNS
ncbi:hypothetical protein LB523_12315 [Mesorhizobium sp. ESP-6-4]|uniref:hypothetical protein n=1 Tax=Mesorhizobium sp. ESP-6-4 TaxID=2876624 RepID=UPI001CCF082D|nr:hypothetical protein [Mesorhizobium sp. ESP-6-4]MBZ9659831.1 hypothetical protein [Mesorhizobium sp. ESP-6-4]